MACSTCNKGAFARIMGAAQQVEQKLFGKKASSGLVAGPAPTVSPGSTDSNVYGDPTARIGLNGTNARYGRR